MTDGARTTSARTSRRSASPATASPGASGNDAEDSKESKDSKEHSTSKESKDPAKEGPRLLRTIFLRRSTEEQAARRGMLAELVRQASEPRDGKPWAGSNSAPTSPTAMGAAMRRPNPVTGNLADGPLRFSASFECGNLLSAKLVCTGGKGASSSTAPPPGAEVEYELHVDNDTQSTTGHTQWFYFSVRNGEYRGSVNFRIVNLRKKKSLYLQGLQPYVFSTRKKSRGWEHFVCQNVSYNTNSNLPRPPKEKSDGPSVKADHNTLSFSYRMEHKDDEIHFASFPPYTYGMMSNFLARLDEIDQAREHFTRSELCRSIGQLPVPLLIISQGLGLEETERSLGFEQDEVELQRSRQQQRRPAKPVIVITARQHPGEVVGSWACQGLLKFLLGPTPAARRLREDFVFHVVPMVNVDGVVHGNSRCTLAGVDPNR
ncbi:unnamed protein product, partial [Polarella glacialis]